MLYFFQFSSCLASIRKKKEWWQKFWRRLKKKKLSVAWLTEKIIKGKAKKREKNCWKGSQLHLSNYLSLCTPLRFATLHIPFSTTLSSFPHFFFPSTVVLFQDRRELVSHKSHLPIRLGGREKVKIGRKRREKKKNLFHFESCHNFQRFHLPPSAL